MVFTTEGLFEIAIDSWSEWDLNPRPLNSIQTLSLYIFWIPSWLLHNCCLLFLQLKVMNKLKFK